MTPSSGSSGDGYTVSEVSQAYGVSRQSVHTWLDRHEAGGLPALAEQSHRPKTSPLQMAPKSEARLLELRRHHPSWGIDDDRRLLSS
jgi:transposase